MCGVTDILISSVGEFFHNVYVYHVKSAYYVLNILSEWKLLSCVWLFVTPWTIQSMEFSRPQYWSGIPFSRGSSQPRDQTQVSHIADEFFTSWATREALQLYFLTIPLEKGKDFN